MLPGRRPALYLHELHEALIDTAVKLHAFVLMGNHVHLLVTPPDCGAVSRLMQRLGRHYVGQLNARHRRTGTLWEGRCKSCLVDSDGYLLQCSRYSDLNPVRARMTDDPIDFPWSSCASLCGRRDDPLLSPHRTYARLGNSCEERGAACRSLLAEVLSDDDLQAIRIYLQQQRALGRDDFREMVEARTRQFAGIRPAHRPGAGTYGNK